MGSLFHSFTVSVLGAVIGPFHFKSGPMGGPYLFHSFNLVHAASHWLQCFSLVHAASHWLQCFSLVHAASHCLQCFGLVQAASHWLVSLPSSQWEAFCVSL